MSADTKAMLHYYEALLAERDELRKALRVADERVCGLIERTKPTSKHLAALLEVTYGLRAALKVKP